MRKDAGHSVATAKPRHPGGPLGWWILGIVGSVLLLALLSLAYAQIMTVHQFENRVPGECYWTDAMAVVIVCKDFPGAELENYFRNFGLLIFQFGPIAVPLALAGAFAGEFRPLLFVIVLVGAITLIAWMLRAAWVLVKSWRIAR
ncbi:MAG: hypothetical protein KAG89_18400 [Fulvimarina manganoxydans]|uniref:hypothetical protein n=1 Tax=Fulvimarina manganoxydans TaxID=937218 RepID=UPI0023533BF7|nr:hypothetical protein [Fulvimarina manganoxydans]MCK5934134.1 hypothetical protein [Fulvimarina manganoxydans]